MFGQTRHLSAIGEQRRAALAEIQSPLVKMWTRRAIKRAVASRSRAAAILTSARSSWSESRETESSDVAIFLSSIVSSRRSGSILDGRSKDPMLRYANILQKDGRQGLLSAAEGGSGARHGVQRECGLDPVKIFFSRNVAWISGVENASSTLGPDRVAMATRRSAGLKQTRCTASRSRDESVAVVGKSGAHAQHALEEGTVGRCEAAPNKRVRRLGSSEDPSARNKQRRAPVAGPFGVNSWQEAPL